MKDLKLKKTLPYILIQLGFYTVLTFLTFLIGNAETAAGVRVVILEFGAFPMLCAITGWTMAQKEGFLPLFGAASALIFIPFMYGCFEVQELFVILIYAVLGYAGTLVGYFQYMKEVKRIEEGRPPEPRRKTLLEKWADRYKLDRKD